MVILSDPLTTAGAADGFAAIGSETRLRVLLALVRAGEDGLPFGAIQTRTGMAPSTLAHHLRALTATGLVAQEKRGRSVISRASYPHLNRLAAYILQECCAQAGRSEGEAP
jgi:ArsR family transcriptional regulator